MADSIYNPSNDIAAQIDALVISTGGAAETVTVNGDRGDYSFNTSDTEVEVLRKPDSAVTTRIADSAGLNPQAEVASIQAQLEGMNAQLEDGTFDPLTGEKVYSILGRQREVMIRQFHQMLRSADAQLHWLAALSAQRKADAQLQVEARERLEWAQGDPHKQALLDDAIARRDAEAEADRLIALRASRKK